MRYEKCRRISKKNLGWLGGEIAQEKKGRVKRKRVVLIKGETDLGKVML